MDVPDKSTRGMELSAAAIAEFLGGVVEGDPSTLVSEFSKIEEGRAGALSFLSNPKYEHYLYTTEASVVLVNKSQKLERPVRATLVRVDDAYGSLARLLTLVAEKRPRKKGIHPTACVEPTAVVGQDVYVGPYAYVGENVILEDEVQVYPHVFVGDNSRVGARSILYAGAKVYHDIEIGVNCIIHAGAVIGADGFGFAPQPDGTYTKIPQLGNVVIGDNVEVGANTTIDRAAMGATRVGPGVKLDNLVQIAHSVEVGENTVIAAQSGIAGSTKVGKRCMFGGQVGLVGHIEIADEVKLGAQAGVSNSIRTPGESMQGTPAMPIRLFFRSSAAVRRLPDMLVEVERLRRQVEGDGE